MVQFFSTSMESILAESAYCHEVQGIHVQTTVGTEYEDGRSHLIHLPENSFNQPVSSGVTVKGVNGFIGQFHDDLLELFAVHACNHPGLPAFILLRVMRSLALGFPCISRLSMATGSINASCCSSAQTNKAWQKRGVAFLRRAGPDRA